MQHDAEKIARAWIENWIAGTPEKTPLASGFCHSSPYGTIEGREKYMEFMKPVLANPPSLSIVKTLASGSEAVVWYEMTTPAGVVPCCDWVQVRDGEIAAITSFYDATALRP